ncbi:MAG: hypothetical protein IKJ73_02330 [Lachnospiraceae bacterium]|nr:hypothetical protein [Lachnospiraceae bacterium]
MNNKIDNNKMHKLDSIFIVGIGVIATLSSMLDILSKQSFPVYSCGSIYGSYALWFILLIYSSLKYKEQQDKPKYIRLYTFFLVTFIHIVFVIVGFAIGILLSKIFNL